MIYGLDLFSGYGGITKALQGIVTPIAYCEIEKYAKGILLSRMYGNELPIAPIWDDVKTLKADLLPIKPSIIYGGFPCQDISIAGTAKGLGGKRSGLFFEVCRLVKEINPEFVFLENVPAIRTRGLLEVVNEFTKMGYDCRWTCITAYSVGAPHKRERWFMLANSKSSRDRRALSNIFKQDEEIKRSESKYKDPTLFVVDAGSDAEFLANRTKNQNSISRGLEGQREKPFGTEKKPKNTSWWETEPNVGRMVDGGAFRVDRTKALGNGVVPEQVRKAFEILIGIEKGKR